jgi:protein ImuA
MLEHLRQTLRVLEKPAFIEGKASFAPLGIGSIDSLLGGGLARGTLHEVAAVSEPHLAAATGFVLGLTARERACVCWIAEDMAFIESGAPYGGGLDAFGLAPERILSVAASKPRDLLWAMEEALRCRTVRVVIGEWRHGAIDTVAIRRLSLAAAESGALAVMLRASPADDASTAATRWIVGASPSAVALHGPGCSRFAAQLVRNRCGPLGSWILEWSDSDGFSLAHGEPLALPLRDRSHRKIARRVA